MYMLKSLSFLYMTFMFLTVILPSFESILVLEKTTIYKIPIRRSFQIVAALMIR